MPTEEEQEQEPIKENIKRKIKVRHSKKDEGIFETGLDVVEHEYELEEDEKGNLQ